MEVARAIDEILEHSGPERSSVTGSSGIYMLAPCAKLVDPVPTTAGPVELNGTTETTPGEHSDSAGGDRELVDFEGCRRSRRTR